MAIVAVATIVLAGCAERRVTATTPQTGVRATMARQIQNAVDAGDGDMQARGLRQRLAANPDDLEARLALAHRYAQRGLPDLALEHYRLAAIRFPDSEPVALGVAKTLREMNEGTQALVGLQAYVAMHASAGWELLSLQGILLDERGKYADAEVSHRAALARDGNRSSLHNNLGYNLTLQGKRGEAAAEFHRALAIDGNSEIAKNNLAELEAGTGPKATGPPVNLWKRVASSVGKVVAGPPAPNAGGAETKK
ncbi:MAG TPA: hypothetical protein VGP79_03565 [Bryobacteraceae bacterium]|jgi:Flp pilus assembly protein TadD|nr:hypothetical protein [Bryobacteraceae bacterium]